MKTTFNWLAIFAAAVQLLGGPARADTTFWTPREFLADAFRTSKRVSFREISIGTAERARIEQRLGYRLAHDHYTVFIANSDDRVDGYALFDDELGQHMPITFAVTISPAGAAVRQEIIAYREPRGDEVRDERFRRQFVGKTTRDPFSLGQDIAAVSGATISSRAMAIGVRRALVLVEELLIKPVQAASTTARR